MTILAIALLAVSAQAKTYTIDPDHSSVGFKIRHLGARVPGTFNKFSGSVVYDEKNPQAWAASAELETASIDTNNEKRDGHLKSADFFDAEKCPKITFKSTKVSGANGKSAKLHGDLTMRCITKPVVLEIAIGEAATDPWGNVKQGFSAKGKINRKDFGVNWNKALDKGGFVLGDDVDLDLEIEAAPSKDDAKESAKKESKAASDAHKH